MYHVTAHGVDERMKNVHYDYYYYIYVCASLAVVLCMMACFGLHEETLRPPRIK